MAITRETRCEITGVAFGEYLDRAAKEMDAFRALNPIRIFIEVPCGLTADEANDALIDAEIHKLGKLKSGDLS